MNFRNFTDSAAWPHTILTHEMFTAMGGHSDWEVMPGFRLETVSFDLMHNIYLGEARDIVASVLRVLIDAGLYMDVSCETDKVLLHIQREIAKDCKDHGSLSKTLKHKFWPKTVLFSVLLIF